MAATASPRATPLVDEKLAAESLKAFLHMDVDGDGMLNEEEFRRGLGSLGMEPAFVKILFNSFDKDGDGSINRQEFLTAMAVMLHPDDHDSQISMAFDAFDTNKDGRLGVDELRHVVGAIFATMEKMGIREETTDVNRTADDLFRQIDTDNKGYVTKDDYMRLATANPELLKKIGLGNPVRRQPSRMRSAGSLAAQISSTGSLYGVPPPPRREGKTNRKRGTTVSFGHDNWELVVQMMLAIRLSVGRARKQGDAVSESQRRKQTPSAAPSGSTQLTSGAEEEASAAKRNGDSSGATSASAVSSTFTLASEHFHEVWRTKIPGHARGQDTAIGFKDYAPLVFRRVRQLFGISDADYMLSLGPEQILGELLLGTMGSLSELFSEGKSGSFFYFSNDGRYLIKTIPHRELSSLISLLPRYVAHVEAQPHTLLPRFMGAHRLKLPHQRRKVHFIVMTNVFSSARVIHHRYDLKGSTQGRTAGKKVLEQFPDVVRKDLDVESPFRLRPGARDALIAQIKSDLDFLREVYTMDYSLLVGVHFAHDDAAAPPADAAAPGVDEASVQQISVAVPDAALAPPDDPASPSPSPPSPQSYPAASVPTATEVPSARAEPAPSSRAEAPSERAISALKGASGGGSGEQPSSLRTSGASAAKDVSAPSVSFGSRLEHTKSEQPTAGKGRGGGQASWRFRRQPPWLDDADGSIEAVPAEEGAAGEIVYFIGVIDILTSWTCMKSLENIIKTVQHPWKPNAHSCVPPIRYANRFERALRKWFDTSV